MLLSLAQGVWKYQKTETASRSSWLGQGELPVGNLHKYVTECSWKKNSKNGGFFVCAIGTCKSLRDVSVSKSVCATLMSGKSHMAQKREKSGNTRNYKKDWYLGVKMYF